MRRRIVDGLQLNSSAPVSGVNTSFGSFALFTLATIAKMAAVTASRSASLASFSLTC